MAVEEFSRQHHADDGLRLSIQAGRAFAEVERADCLKSEFLDRISHRVRTVIQTARGMSDLLRLSGLSAEQEDYLRNIGDSIEDLFSVAGEIVDFSKIETGSLVFTEEDFHLKEVLDHELYPLGRRAEEKGLRLTCAIDKDVPEAMSGDAPRLAQALLAVAGNAVRYTARGGVDIEVTNGGYHSDGRIFITFSVRDSGPGLSRGQLGALHRLLAEPKPHLNIPEGLGLGLVVTCRLIQLLQGRMTVASNERGTTFALSLPFREIPVGDDGGEMETAPFFEEPSPLFALNGAKILMAEDDPINSLLLATILRQAGAQAQAVSSGQAALEAMRADDAFDAVLMDVQLPEMDGLETARRIRLLEKELGYRRRPILALTAQVNQIGRGVCLHAGIDEYCVKPIDKDELLTKLGNYLTPAALVVASAGGGRHDMLRFLVEKGFRVTLAETARAALYEAALSHFGLILLDTQFLREDSLEITKVIRRFEDYTGRRAVIIGIGVDEGARERRFIAGLDSCLRWPFSGDELTALMTRLGHFRKA